MIGKGELLLFGAEREARHRGILDAGWDLGGCRKTEQNEKER
jgi:hypothetical protein